MLFYIFYLIVIFLILIFIALVAIYLVGLIYSSFKGSPYVPTKRKILQNILKQAGLRKGQTFIDIGCGDGRVVEEAIVGFKAKGTGIDINPLLIFRANARAKIKKIDADYRIENIKKLDLVKYNMVYVFLMPEFINKISHQLKSALLNKSTIVSHGFKVNQLKKYLKKTIKDKTFPTYIYRISSKY
ncbi:MAG: methyltransferase domain-containing protein [bacterium]